MSHTDRGPLVIGIGNPDRGDDAAGRAVARWLDGRLPADVEIIEHDGEPASLLARLEGVATAILIDACTSGAPIGTVQRFDVSTAPLPQKGFSTSTHALGLAEAVELARVLGQLPDRCIVYAIEAGSFEPGTALSAPIAAAIIEVGSRVHGEICGSGEPEGRTDA